MRNLVWDAHPRARILPLSKRPSGAPLYDWAILVTSLRDEDCPAAHETLLAVPPAVNPIRCLILACGNTLRGDDGAGPWLAAWAEERFAADQTVRVISRQQWTPDLAEELAHVESAIFIDCAMDAPAGAVRVSRVKPSPPHAGLATHHVGAAELLALSEDLYASLPHNALLLTIGAGSIEMGETFSKSLRDALPEACKRLEDAVLRMLAQDL